MSRRIGSVLLALAAALATATGAALFLVARHDLGPFAARRASAAFGRPVSIGELRVAPGRWITVDLSGARLGNAAGGSRPAMAEIGRLTAQVDAVSLLRGGPVVVRRLAVEAVASTGLDPIRRR